MPSRSAQPTKLDAMTCDCLCRQSPVTGARKVLALLLGLLLPHLAHSEMIRTDDPEVLAQAAKSPYSWVPREALPESLRDQAD